MGGKPWEELMATLKNTLNIILGKQSLKESVKVTVINYASTARMVFKKRDPDLELLSLITFSGGGTEFEAPLTLGYNTIIETKNEFDLFTMAFLTDGGAPYPTTIINKINADVEKVQSRMRFHGIQFGSETSNLKKMATDLNGNYSNVINVEELKNTFKEIINIGFKRSEEHTSELQSL